MCKGTNIGYLNLLFSLSETWVNKESCFHPQSLAFFWKRCSYNYEYIFYMHFNPWQKSQGTTGMQNPHQPQLHKTSSYMFVLFRTQNWSIRAHIYGQVTLLPPLCMVLIRNKMRQYSVAQSFLTVSCL